MQCNKKERQHWKISGASLNAPLFGIPLPLFKTE
jgi:hypothetical protein